MVIKTGSGRVSANTMDVNYYGPNPQMGFWYLGALRAAEEMAFVMEENDFAEKCRHLFEKGSTWLDSNLFNESIMSTRLLILPRLSS